MTDNSWDSDLLGKKLSDYMDNLFQHSTGVIAEMESLASERNFPIVGPHVGRLLGLMVKLARAQRIFEMGSGFGYSAYFMAAAQGRSGKIVCTDLDVKNKELAQKFLAGIWTTKIDFRIGHALDILAAESGTFDLIFNDVDKEDYPKALEIAIPRLAPGGLFITDNVLWYGRVADSEFMDSETQGIRKFNSKLVSHPSLEVVIIPLRDGIAIARKKSPY